MKPRPQKYCPVIVAITCAFVAVIAGCDSRPPCYPVSGVIKFADDSTAQFGSIEFRSDTEPPSIARGLINQDGSFTAKSAAGRPGLIAGNYKLIIVQIMANARSGGVTHHHGLEVDKKYSTYKTSDLEIEVTPDGENNFVLTVDSNW